MTTATALLFAGLLPMSIAAAQQTWIVDQNGGGNFTDLPAAYDAASPGDTLLLNAGSYSGLHRSAGASKGVRILGAGPNQVSVLGAIRLSQIPGGQSLVLSGMTVTGDGSGNPNLRPGIDIYDCDHVVVSNIVANGATTPGYEGAAALSLSTCDGIVDRVVATGGNGTNGGGPGLPGGSGARLEYGRFTVTNCTFRSGDSGWAYSPYAIIATGEGCVLVAATCSVDETSCTAGTPPSPGYEGLGALYASCFVTIANHTGQQITTLSARQGATIAVTTTEQSLVGPADLPIGQSGTYTVHGPAGSVAALCLSLDAAALEHPVITGPSFLVGNTFPVVAQFLTLNGSGQATATLAVPNLASLQDVFVYGQVVGGWSALPLRASGVSAARIR